jgi:hypothetical protein
MKLLVIQFSPASYFIRFGLKYAPHHHVLKHTQSTVFS